MNIKDRTIRLERELELIYKIDAIMETTSELDEVLVRLIDFLPKALNVQMIYLLLHNDQTGDFEIRATNDRNILSNHNYEIPKRIARRCADVKQPLFFPVNPLHYELSRAKVNNVLSMPLMFNKKVNGVIIIMTRGERRIKKITKSLLLAVIRQVDSAIEYLKKYKDIEVKNKKLDLLFKIDNIRDTVKDLKTSIKLILEEIRNVLLSNNAFFATYSREEDAFNLDISSGNNMSTIFKKSSKELLEICTHSLKNSDVLRANKISPDIKNIMVCPVVVQKNMIGFLGVLNSDSKDSFTDEDVHIVNLIRHKINSVVSENFDKQKLKEIFSRYVSSSVVDKILQDEGKDYTKVDRQDVSILFGDLRGFTSFSENQLPETVVKMLNDYFEEVTQSVFEHNGTVDKYVGDEIMAIYGAPIYHSNHALNAVLSALDMQKRYGAILKSWKSKSSLFKMFSKADINLGLGIGINTGDAVVGNIGSKQRMDYTVIGDSVNVACRLCGIAKAGQIIITESTYKAVKNFIKCKELDPVTAKGKREPIRVWEVIGLKDND